MGSRACKRHRVDSPKVPGPPAPTRPVRLPSEILVDVALFLCRLDLDAIQFSCQRHRAFVRDNTHLVPLRRLAQISHKEWDVVSDLFGETPLTIRVSNEVVIGGEVWPGLKEMRDFLRPFALINCLECTYFTEKGYYSTQCNPVSEKFDDFLQWCTENSITQLKVDSYDAKLSDDAVLEFCFGPHGTDSDPRHLKAPFQCGADFLERLCEANRKCSRSGQITIELTAKRIDAPNSGELAPYRVEGPRRIDRFFEETVFELPQEYGLRIVYAYRHPVAQGAASKCRIDVYRPAHSD